MRKWPPGESYHKLCWQHDLAPLRELRLELASLEETLYKELYLVTLFQGLYFWSTNSFRAMVLCVFETPLSPCRFQASSFIRYFAPPNRTWICTSLLQILYLLVCLIVYLSLHPLHMSWQSTSPDQDSNRSLILQYEMVIPNVGPESEGNSPSLLKHLSRISQLVWAVSILNPHFFSICQFLLGVTNSFFNVVCILWIKSLILKLRNYDKVIIYYNS